MLTVDSMLGCEICNYTLVRLLQVYTCSGDSYSTCITEGFKRDHTKLDNKLCDMGIKGNLMRSIASVHDPRFHRYRPYSSPKKPKQSPYLDC
jgi:hypothetical protein